MLAAILVLSPVACGGDDDEEATPPPSIAEPTTTTDPYAIPPVIDAAYVNRVLAGIDGVVSDVFRLVIEKKSIPPEAVTRVETVYQHPEDMHFLLSGLQQNLATNFEDYRPVPGNRKSTVERLISASGSCVFVEAFRDYSEQLVSADDDVRRVASWIALAPKDPAADPARYNPTPWVISLEKLRSDGPQPPSPCAAS